VRPVDDEVYCVASLANTSLASLAPTSLASLAPTSLANTSRAVVVWRPRLWVFVLLFVLRRV